MNITKSGIGGFGDRIRLARERAGLSQEQLAKRSGVTRAAISQWESGMPTRLQAVAFLRAMRACAADPFEVMFREVQKPKEELPPRAHLCIRRLLQLPPHTQEAIFDFIDALATNKKTRE